MPIRALIKVSCTMCLVDPKAVKYFFRARNQTQYQTRIVFSEENVSPFCLTSMFQQNICAILIEIQAPFQEIWCRQAISKHSKSSCYLENVIKITSCPCCPFKSVSSSRKRAYIILTPLNPFFYSKTVVYRGIHYFSYFCSKT